MRSVRVLRNVVTNYARFFLSGLTGFVLTPVMVHAMGDASYGLWVTVFSLTGYFGLIDQGIRPSLIRYVSRDAARGDAEGMNRTINTALALFTVVGVLALAAVTVVALNFTRWFTIPAADAPEVTQTLLVAGLAMALGFPFGVYGAVLSGLQRYDLGNWIGIAVTVARAVAFVVVLRMGGGLLELAWVSLIMSLVGHGLTLWCAHRLLPEVRYGRGWVSRQHLGMIGSYGGIAFVGALATSLSFQSNALVITAFLGAAAVTIFSIAAGLVDNVRSLVHSATFVLSPTASEMETRGETERLHALLVTGAKYSVLVSWPALFALLIFGEPFLVTWMGEPYRNAYPILVALTAPTLLSLPQATASALLYGVSRHKGVVTFAIVGALLNLGLSILWARPFGLMGVAMGTAIPLTLVSGVGFMIYTARALAIPLGVYAWEGMLRPGLVSLAFIAPALLLRWKFSLIGWMPLALAVTFCGLVFAAAAWRLSVDPPERARWSRAIAGLFGRSAAPEPAAKAEGA